MYSYVETAHVIAIMLFVGAIAMVDLRLLGVSFRQTTVSQMLSRMLPWTVVGFIILTITGLLLFYAIPVRTYHSVWFRIKAILLVIGAINIGVFTFVVERDKARWDVGPTPAKARLAAIISLSVWVLVIVFGRLIAYNWADCDEATSQFVLQIAGCPAQPPGS
ncbi:MAG: DUF6644 family protein [Caulobacterales bacterium]